MFHTCSFISGAYEVYILSLENFKWLDFSEDADNVITPQCQSWDYKSYEHIRIFLLFQIAIWTWSQQP